MAVEAGVPTEFGDLFAELAGEVDLREQVAGGPQALARTAVRFGLPLLVIAFPERLVNDSNAVVKVLAGATSSGGRSGPELGAKVALLGVHRPDERELGGVVTVTPSRSTRFWPLAAASRSTSTRWSSSRFTSST